MLLDLTHKPKKRVQILPMAWGKRKWKNKLNISKVYKLKISFWFHIISFIYLFTTEIFLPCPILQLLIVGQRKYF